MRTKKTFFIQIISLIFVITFVLTRCAETPPFDKFVYILSEAIIYKNKALFQRVLLKPEELAGLNETRFNGKYDNYLKINMDKFSKAVNFSSLKRLYITNIIKGAHIEKFGIQLVDSSKIFFNDTDNNHYHMRILYVVYTKKGEYKLFLFD